MSYSFNPKALTLGIYNGVTDTKGARITLDAFTQLRASAYLEGPDKKTLPCVTIGGLYTGRKLGGLVMPSGLVQIDIDAKDNAQGVNWESQRDQLAQDFQAGEMSAFVSVSASGAGLFALVYFAGLVQTFEEAGADAYNEAHKRQTFKLTRAAQGWSGLVCDASVINRPNSLRFISADRSPAFVNWPGRPSIAPELHTFDTFAETQALEAV